MTQTIKCNRCNNDALTIEHDRFALCAYCWLKQNAPKKEKKRNDK